jgi:hypothetical protein
MEDNCASKDMKDRLSNYQSAIIKYCEELPRKTPFFKNSLRCLQEGILEDADNTKSKKLRIRI